MKFGKSALMGLLLGVAGTADAFSIGPHAPQVKKLGRVYDEAAAAAVSTNNNSWRAPMQMVAGGAERAYGEDYYDGKYIFCYICGCNWLLVTEAKLAKFGSQNPDSKCVAVSCI